MSNFLVPDITPLTEGIGGLISQRINSRLQSRALEGDQGALVKLSSRDPRGAGAIGGILQGNQERDAASKQKRQQVKNRILKTLSGVSRDKLPQTIESVIPLLQSDPDLKPLIGEAQGLLQRFGSDPEAVINEIQTASAILNTDEQLKVRKTVTYPNGAVLNIGADGVATVTDEQGNTFRQGQSGYGQALKRGLQSEVDLAAGKAGSREQAKADVKLETSPEIKRRETKATKQESREQGFIDSGIDAADSVMNTKRAIDLLKQVETGGFSAAALRAKQIFGIESADEGDLANALGVAVLQQLKPIFGAAFTAQEGQRLERLSAGFGKSPAANRRILEQQLKIADRAARRALKLAEAKGDDFTAGEIRTALSQIEEVNLEQPQQAPQFQDFKIISVE